MLPGLDTFISVASGPPATVTYISTAKSNANAASYTFSAQNIGTAAADRIVVVCAYLGGSATGDITSITVGGDALTLVGVVTETGTGGAWAIGYRLITTGATADVIVAGGAAGRAAIDVYNVTAITTAPSANASAKSSLLNTSSISVNITTEVDGVVIASAGHGSSTPTWTWSGATERADQVWSEQGSFTTASKSTIGDVLTISATPSGNSRKVINAAVWR